MADGVGSQDSVGRREVAMQDPTTRYDHVAARRNLHLTLSGRVGFIEG
jgi:hypothetical protein